MVEEGARAYIERINVRGNTRTRDYVIRREFDIAEGDAYNRALIDRAERRLKNLDYFKAVKITNEPGSAPDRIIINVDVEEQSTGEFSVAGGYSTADGFVAEVTVGERNLLGRGQYAQAAVQYGQRTRGFELSFAEPYFLDYRLRVRRRPLRQADSTRRRTTSYDSETIGGGFALRLSRCARISSLQLRYSVYQQEIDARPDLLTTATTSIRTSGSIRSTAGYPIRRGLASIQPATRPPGYAVWQLLCERRGIAGGPSELVDGPGDRLAGRLRPRLQHARQQPEPDQRPARRVASRTSPASAAT